MLAVGGMANTGEKCEQSGLYLVSGMCGHAAQRAAKRDEVLPACPICGTPACWTLLREFFALAEVADYGDSRVAGRRLE
jgi:hypothetical protein